MIKTIKIKTDKEIERMRESGKLAAFILQQAIEFAKAGVTTDQINNLVHTLTIENNAIPSPLNYHGFPKSVCTSVNEVVTHGIPSDYTLKEGDIVNIDVTCNLNGYHGDTSRTVLIGSVDSKVKHLVRITYESMMAGIEVAKAGNYFGDIGAVIQDIADEHGYGVVREYCGHGIGRGFHEPPNVLHYRIPNRGARIEKGMVFTIEPMLNLGTERVRTASDGWTVYTVDGLASAQFEHTIAITNQGAEVLTSYLSEVY